MGKPDESVICAGGSWSMSEDSHTWPFITVVIPVLNEEAHILMTLEGLLYQEYPRDRYEIIVADGGSTDRTVELVRAIEDQHPQVKLLPNPDRRSSAGRNVGFR